MKKNSYPNIMDIEKLFIFSFFLSFPFFFFFFSSFPFFSFLHIPQNVHGYREWRSHTTVQMVAHEERFDLRSQERYLLSGVLRGWQRHSKDNEHRRPGHRFQRDTRLGLRG